jgi:putative salt-induced outer membrane protein YdiY
VKALLVFLCAALFVPATFAADQVSLKNGDRLTGAIIKSDAKNLVIKTEFAGDVSIAWDAVTAITSTSQLHLTLKGGQTVIGTVATAPDGKFAVTTNETGVVTASKDAVAAMRSDAEQKAYDTETARLRNPRVIDLWTGFLDLGYASTHGNTNASTFSLTGNAVRETSRDKITAYYTQIFSSSNASGTQLTTADAKRGGIAYNINIAPKWFVFGSVDLESDQFQSLDLRFVPAGGIGYHAIKNMSTWLDFDLGAAANNEFFSTGLNRTAAALLVGEELEHKFNSTTTLHEKLVFFPEVSGGGNYRINFDTSAITVLRKWLSWQLTISDRYLSNPLPGKKTNDILLTTGLRLTFAK